jgi:hypothetical protein
VGAKASGRATRSDATLGGRPARRLAWRGFDVYVTLRDGIVHAYLASEGAPGPGAFRLLD